MSNKRFHVTVGQARQCGPGLARAVVWVQPAREMNTELFVVFMDSEHGYSATWLALSCKCWPIYSRRCGCRFARESFRIVRQCAGVVGAAVVCIIEV